MLYFILIVVAIFVNLGYIHYRIRKLEERKIEEVYYYFYFDGQELRIPAPINTIGEAKVGDIATISIRCSNELDNKFSNNTFRLKIDKIIKVEKDKHVVLPDNVDEDFYITKILSV